VARTADVVPPGTDTQVKEIREWTAYADTEWQPIREEAATDMRAAAGDPWDPKERRAREKANRPVLVFDEFQQYINQVVNDFRANPIGVQFSPVGDGANDDTAKFYEDKMREVEYRSNAQIHYTTAAENAVMRSYGFVRVTTRYESCRAPQSARSGSTASQIPTWSRRTRTRSRPTCSTRSAAWCASASRSRTSSARWPKAEVKSFGGDVRKLAPTWVHGDHLYVGELWEKRTTSKKLHTWGCRCRRSSRQTPRRRSRSACTTTSSSSAAGCPRGLACCARDDVDVPHVVQVLTNGLEVLEEREWRGKYIPIVGCFGRVLYMPDDAMAARSASSSR
jgi:hypothetical protein